jgi:ferritin-like metal-binding protein YciE
MKIQSLQDLLVDQLKDLYNAETQLVKALPKMAKVATSPDLKAAFEDHLEQTKGHVERLDRVFEELGARPKGKTCEAMEGLIDEGKGLIEEDIEPTVLDAGIICAAQKVEHYEMAGYGCVRTWARQLGHETAANLLQETLDEEAHADQKLTQIAESAINLEASRT